MLETFNPPGLAPATRYSHGARSGGFVFVAGQLGWDEAGKIVEPGDMAAQFARALANIRLVLDAAGSAPDRVVKLTIYVTDLAGFRSHAAAIGAARVAFFGDHRPASTLVGVTGLVDPQALVEIDCVAVGRG